MSRLRARFRLEIDSEWARFDRIATPANHDANLVSALQGRRYGIVKNLYSEKATVRRRATSFALCLLAASATLAGCGRDLGVGAAGELKIGDIDPKAPEGWPLAIGDRDIVPMGMAGGVGSRFEFWKGNCCINWIEGIPYTASWREEEALFGWKYYAGHVQAKPTERWRQDYDPTWRPEYPLVLKPTVIEDGKRYPKRNHVPPLRIKGPLKWDGPLPINLDGNR